MRLESLTACAQLLRPGVICSLVCTPQVNAGLRGKGKHAQHTLINTQKTLHNLHRTRLTLVTCLSLQGPVLLNRAFEAIEHCVCQRLPLSFD
jgi:hypothetical protein